MQSDWQDRNLLPDWQRPISEPHWTACVSPSSHSSPCSIISLPQIVVGNGATEIVTESESV